ncbi:MULTISPECIES: MarR family winged helix-turn-helix transcriptional regulator [Streptacidiphilus]|uniref:MarR family winged helix-turn-helix transcriptional regulator n=2 Tax=Streptacidiphilus TaxID=228398 RepID=A0ABV6UPB7_9ACTN|nr:MarR family transcriptional regulator [Streptacidiphilus jeojiense]
MTTAAEDGQQGVDAATRAYRVMRELVLEEDERMVQLAEVTGMSFIRSKVLRRLAAGPMRMSELTARLRTDKPYTTLVVDDLERRGLVVRSVHPDDRRCKIVTNTPAGQEMAELAESILARPPQRLLALDQEELALLERVLGKVVGASSSTP